MKIIIILKILLISFIPYAIFGEEEKANKKKYISKGRTYIPEEGTFDRRKRIVIQPICRLVKQTIVPGDVVCEYVSQKKDQKNKQIYLGAPGERCQREITCPVK
tara:strand:+ start:747 stop:1058 length:312 start_codon:yes stop_codon:yes gene_type:complete